MKCDETLVAGLDAEDTILGFAICPAAMKRQKIRRKRRKYDFGAFFMFVSP